MKNELKLIETVELSNTVLHPLSQTGDKNTQVAHADHVVINNHIYQANPTSIDIASVNLNLVKPNSGQSAAKLNVQTETDREYYNLFVVSSEIKNCRFTIQKDRALKSDTAIAKQLSDLSCESRTKIKTFPSLFMNENTEYGGRTDPGQETYYGFVTDIKIQENGKIRIKFRCEAKISQQAINDIID